MRPAFSLLSLAAWSSVATFGLAESFTRCGTEPSESFLQLVAGVVDEEAKGAISKVQESIEIDTYFHVVAANDTEEVSEGYISDKMLDDQLKVLKDGYKPHGISYNLIETTRTVNRDWAIPEDESVITNMKRALRKGDYKTLNVYFVINMGRILGYCPFPEDVKEGSDKFIEDGCTVVAGSVPGGTMAPYNLGMTLTHEVGHYHGLFHTFQDGCLGGDMVDDTPAQAGPTDGCPTTRDSCPLHVGLDPIHNYMDYSDDVCMREFTPGQEKRMFTMWQKFRA